MDQAQVKERLAEKIKYRDILEKQIEDNNKKRQFKDVMTEHERKINGLDISAYQNMDSQLYSKVVGAKDYQSIGISPQKHTIVKSDSVVKTDSPSLISYELARRINRIDDVMKNSRRLQQSPNTGSPQKLLEMAIKNMNDPRMEYMKYSTNNKIYGYEEGYKQYAQNKSFDNLYAIRRSDLNTLQDSKADEQQMKDKNYSLYNNRYDMHKDDIPNIGRSSINNNSLALAGKVQITNNGKYAQNVPYLNNRQDDYKDIYKEDIEKINPLAAGHMRRQLTNYNIITGSKLSNSKN